MPSFFAFKNGEKIGDLLGANPPGLEVRTASTLGIVTFDMYFIKQMLIQEAKSQA
jgi:hypothetical protein